MNRLSGLLFPAAVALFGHPAIAVPIPFGELKPAVFSYSIINPQGTATTIDLPTTMEVSEPVSDFVKGEGTVPGSIVSYLQGPNAKDRERCPNPF